MSAPRFWAALPAAGIGRRMGGETPKQYLSLAGRPVIEHTLERLCGFAPLQAVVVAVRAGDPWWPRLRLPAPRQPRVVEGGDERCHSVLACLRLLADEADADDWVLVHDAVRPCVRATDLQTLVDVAGAHPVGGILALPVRDTMKRTDQADEVLETVSREHLWHALTPQMFRLGALKRALEAALAAGWLPTDEAQAMEHVGARARLVEGHADNIKITRPQDLALAGLYLAAQKEEDE